MGIVLNEETKRRFGYYPDELSNGSHKLVVCLCPICKKIYEVQKRFVSDGKPCKTCKNRIVISKNRNPEKAKQALLAHNERCKSAGLSPRYLPLLTDEQRTLKRRKINREFRRRWRQTPEGKMINRLRVALRQYLKGKSWSCLSYTKEELVAHIKREMERYDYKCPMCGTTIDWNNFDIDHKIPLSTARNEQEVIQLFELENLSVLCSKCNRWRKKNKIITY